MTASAPGNSISLLEDKIITSECRRTLDLWLKVRGDSLAPTSGQVNVEDLFKSLPFISILEYRSEDVLTFKFAGSELNVIQGVEITGLNFFDLSPPGQKEIRKKRMTMAISQPCAIYATIIGKLSDGAAHSQEVIALPILADTPTQSPGFLAAFKPLSSYQLRMPSLQKDQINLASGFHFVDIGAGVPSDLDAVQCTGVLAV